SARSTIQRAGRSFTEPAGLLRSSFAQISAPRLGERRPSRTSGVLPTRSSTPSKILSSTPRARPRNSGHFKSGSGRRLSRAGARSGIGSMATRSDPRHEGPKPPFPKQEQPAPGAEAPMRPAPDHGEESYVG